MLIQGLETVAFNRLQALFGTYVISPAVIDTQFTGEWSALGGGVPDPATGLTMSSNDPFADDSTQGGMTFNQIARVCHPAWVKVWHDNVVAPDSLPSVGPNGAPPIFWGNHQSTVSSAQMFSYTRKTIAVSYNSMRWGSATPETMIVTGNPVVPCQAFTWRIKAAPCPNQDTPVYTSVRFRMSGSGTSTPRWYAVGLTYGVGVVFGYCDTTVDGLPNDDYWVLVDNAKIGANFSQTLSGDWPRAKEMTIDPASVYTNTDGDGDPDEHTLQVQFIAGQLHLTWNNETVPFIWPHEIYGDSSGVPDWCIDLFQVAQGGCYFIDWSVHLTKFLTTATILSPDVPLATTPSDYQAANVVFRVHTLPFLQLAASGFDSNIPGFLPPGSGVSTTVFDYNDEDNPDTPGQFMRFNLNITGAQTGTYQGTAYADYGIMVNAITTTFPAETSSLEWTPTILGSDGAPPMPESLEIMHQFDINTLSYKSRCSLTFPNFNPIWTNSAGSGYVDTLGHFGCTIDIGSQGLAMNGDLIQGGSTYRQFTGFMNTDFVNTWEGGARDRITISGEDFWLQCDVPIYNLRFFDWMNAYFVMHELAQFVGIPDDQIGFMDYVPDDPYSPSSGLSDDQQIFLPGGPAGSQLTRFAGGTKARDIMIKIGYGLAYSVFFDVTGVLQFQPFMLPSGWQGAPVKLFSSFAGEATSDLSTCGLSPGADEVWTGTFRGGLRETRNAVMTIGPLIQGNIGNVVTAYLQDTASITTDGWGAGGNPNFKGFKDLFVWIDNLFAYQAYASQAATQMINFLSIPDRDVEFTCATNPLTPVYPGYLVKVLNSRSGSTEFNMFVTGVRINHAVGTIPAQTITARIIPTGFTV